MFITVALHSRKFNLYYRLVVYWNNEDIFCSLFIHSYLSFSLSPSNIDVSFHMQKEKKSTSIYFNVLMLFIFFRVMYVNCFFMMLKYGNPCEVSFLRIYFYLLEKIFFKVYENNLIQRGSKTWMFQWTIENSNGRMKYYILIRKK